MAKSTRAQSRRATRKAKFPLWLHPESKQWCKVHKGKRYYFGEDKDQALVRYLAARADIEAGRKHQSRPQAAGELDLKTLANHFLTFKRHRADNGELTQRTFQDYYDSAERLLKHFGGAKRVEDLSSTDLMNYRAKLAETRGPVALGNEIQRVRTILGFAFNEGLVDRPVRVGSAFAKPSKRAYRQARAERGERLFTHDELKLILKTANPILRAMVLLGLNCGLGNADIGQLKASAIGWESRWLTYPRVKTGVHRRAWLWTETLEALRLARELRPIPKNPEDDGLVFVTKFGQPWHKDAKKSAGPLSAEFRDLLDDLGIYRKGLSFYTLRHQFQTLGDETGDETAVQTIMGHVNDSMSANYRQRFPDARLQRVADHVHAWMFPKEEEQVEVQDASKGGES